MRRAFVLGLVAFAAVVTYGVGAAPAAAPAFDSAQGAGKYGGTFDAPACITIPGGAAAGSEFCLRTTRQFSFSAKQLGFGGRASGVYTHERTTGGGRFTGRVTCLNVLGEAAVFAGILTEAPDPAPGFPSAVGEPFVVWVVDNGTASDGDPPDLISPIGVIPSDDPDRPLFPAAFPNVCPQPAPSPYGYFPLTDGNIVVDDQSRPGVTLP